LSLLHVRLPLRVLGPALQPAPSWWAVMNNSSLKGQPNAEITALDASDGLKYVEQTAQQRTRLFDRSVQTHSRDELQNRDERDLLTVRVTVAARTYYM
jgi:hypothetical protein